MDIQTLKEEISTHHDARRTAYGHIRHRLEDIVIIGLCVAICGGEDFADMETFGRAVPRRTTLDKGHGRVEEREYALLTDVGWLAQRLQWAGLNGVGRVVSTVWEKGAARTETRYFITSLTDVGEFAYAVRRHWSMESQLHWCLDVVFREDASRARKDSSPLNMNVLRKTALTCLNEARYGRLSRRKMMFKAALNPEVLLDVLFLRKK